MADPKDAQFDPYHKWLAIPKDQRPPTFYQLLGLTAGENDADVIEEAAIRQSTHLRTYQMGPQAELCKKLLNEIGRARQVLLNPNKRAEYDQQLALAQDDPPAPPETAFVPRAASKSFAGFFIKAGALVVLVGVAVVGFIVWTSLPATDKKNPKPIVQAPPTPRHDPKAPTDAKAKGKDPKVVAPPPSPLPTPVAAVSNGFAGPSTSPWYEYPADPERDDKLRPLKVVYLSDLDERDAFVVRGAGWGFGKAGNLHDPLKRKIVVQDKPATKGLSLHPEIKAPSRVSYALPKNAAYFRTAVGFNEPMPPSALKEYPKKDTCPVRFEVHGNGKLLAASKSVNLNEIDRCTLDVKGVNLLELRCYVVGNSNYNCHCVWLDPRIYVTE